jgi:hypothetical protein
MYIVLNREANGYGHNKIPIGDKNRSTADSTRSVRGPIVKEFSVKMEASNA